MGTVKAVTDQNGSVVFSVDNLPFGRQLDKSGELEETHGFTGKEFDSDIGLYYFNVRWYDQESGRFVSEDPGHDGDNWYIYCTNNPLSYNDPTGMIHQDSNGNWALDTYDTQWDSQRNSYGFWLYNDNFFAYGSKGYWFNDPYKLGAAEAFLNSFDFSRSNWVRAGGYYIPFNESRRVQTIQAAMGIDVSGWYDDQTKIAVGTLQDMYGVNNSDSWVFGLNTLKALNEAKSNVWDYHQFSDAVRGNVAEAKTNELLGDILINAAIFGGGKKFLSGTLPEATIAFNPLEAGPLQDVALTFRSATYMERTLKKATTLYRVIGKDDNPAGSFWTTTKPTGSVQSMLDSAILPEWGNPATNVVKITVPAGTRIYQGIAAPQGGLLGGGIQVYIPQVEPQWIQAIAPIGGI